MARKSKKELTIEEKLEIEKQRGLDNIEEEKIHFNEPTYEFEIGDRVIYGALKESIVDYISDDKKVYGLRCIATDNNYGNPYDYQTYRICGWHEIRPITHGTTNFGSNQDVRINFINSEIHNLIHKYYSFGVNMNPDYQRDYVWELSDKQLLIDSIFNNIDIGKFTFVHLDYKKWDETGCGYEILDGKQRLSTIIEFYENRFPYKGVYYNDLSGRDKRIFKNHSIVQGEVSETERKDVLKYFLMLNRTGKVMDQKHLDNVEQMYNNLCQE